MTSSGEAAPALEVDGLEAGYGRVKVLRGVSLSVPAGSIVALLGPNGAGKTTLLRAVSGFVPLSGGSIRLQGVDISRWRPHRRFAAGLGHVPEGRGVFRGLTVRENLRMQAMTSDIDDPIERAAGAFPVLGQRLDQLAGTMSGGQQQMLAMASAYVRDPSVVVIDEASLGLAPVIVDEIFEFLESCSARGSSLILVDQFAQRVLAMATTAYVLARGTIVFAGSASELSGDQELFERYLGRHRDDDVAVVRGVDA